MKTKRTKELNLKVIFKNKPDLRVLDSGFYFCLLDKINELKNLKEKKD